MIAFESDFPAHTIVEKLREDHNTLVLLAGNRNQYVRILPPLNTNKEEADIFLGAVENIMRKV